MVVFQIVVSWEHQSYTILLGHHEILVIIGREVIFFLATDPKYLT
jgi:hypothetical protein